MLYIITYIMLKVKLLYICHIIFKDFYELHNCAQISGLPLVMCDTRTLVVYFPISFLLRVQAEDQTYLYYHKNFIDIFPRCAQKFLHLFPLFAARRCRS